MKYEVAIQSWNDVKDTINDKNPEVYELLKSGMTRNDKFLVVRYPFGSNLLKSGYLCLPADDGTVPLYESSRADEGLQKHIADDFPLIPFGLLSTGYLEVYWNTNEKIIPRGYVRSGNLFGTRIFSYSSSGYNFKHAWSISSGARSLCLLPRIKDIEKFKRLKADYQVNSDLPNKFKDQWDLFSDIHDFSEDKWYSEVIYFSNKTIEKMRTARAFEAFRIWLYQRVSVGTSFDRNQASFDFIWEQFIRFIEGKGFKEKSHIYNVAKHLILVAIGEEFAFVPTENDTVAPVKLLTNAFLDSYRTNYYPSLIYASKLDFSKRNHAVYYSLQNPIHLDPFPEKESTTSDLDDIRGIKLIHEKFFEYINSTNGQFVRESIIAEVPNHVSFKYFHTVKDRLRITENSKDIISQDPSFKILNSATRKKDLPFCYSSTIFKGCIQVTRHE